MTDGSAPAGRRVAKYAPGGSARGGCCCCYCGRPGGCGPPGGPPDARPTAGSAPDSWPSPRSGMSGRGVGYVGDAACARCHADVVESYRARTRWAGPVATAAAGHRRRVADVAAAGRGGVRRRRVSLHRRAPSGADPPPRAEARRRRARRRRRGRRRLRPRVGRAGLFLLGGARRVRRSVSDRLVRSTAALRRRSQLPRPEFPLRAGHNTRMPILPRRSSARRLGWGAPFNH